MGAPYIYIYIYIYIYDISRLRVNNHIHLLYFSCCFAVTFIIIREIFCAFYLKPDTAIEILTTDSVAVTS